MKKFDIRLVLTFTSQVPIVFDMEKTVDVFSHLLGFKVKLQPAVMFFDNFAEAILKQHPELDAPSNELMQWAIDNQDLLREEDPQDFRNALDKIADEVITKYSLPESLELSEMGSHFLKELLSSDLKDAVIIVIDAVVLPDNEELANQ